jgi:hypothetical protein
MLMVINRVLSKRMLSGTVALTSACIMNATATAGTIIYVDASAPAGGDGQSWETAFASLQDGLAAAVAGDQVWVAASEYKPAPPNGDRSISFQLKSGVELYGGFAGGETSLDERDWVANSTILSGDLNGDDVGAIDDDSRLENSWRVVVASNTDPTAILDGFVVTAGDTRNGTVNHGAGIFSEDGAATIRNCTATRNYAAYGVGIASLTVLCPSLTNCVFRENWAYFTGGSGGAIYNAADLELADCVFEANVGKFAAGLFFRDCAVRLTRCTFRDNVVTNTDGTGAGGGLYIYESATVTADECLFEGNLAGSGAGGAVVFGNATFTRCVFQNNGAGNVGAPALAVADSTVAIDCIFRGNTSSGVGAVFVQSGPATLINCLLTGNSAEDSGAALAALAAGTTMLINCTISNNSAMEFGGGIARVGFNVPFSIVNCVLWGNIDSTGSSQSAQIYHSSQTGPAPTVDYTCVQGWTGALGGVGNFGLDPLFIDADGPDNTPGTEDDDLHLLPNSPCIDVGDNDALPPDIEFDLDGNPRIQNMIIDLGVYEHEPVCHGDADGTGTVNIDDLLLVINNWGQTGINPADLTGNGVVNIDDLLTVINRWGVCP